MTLSKDKQRLMLHMRLATLQAENYAWDFFKRAYPWQHEFFDAAIYYKQRMLMAANQVGKTETVCVEACYHLTGIYPEGWKGKTFNFPISAWALGVSTEQIRDVLQLKLLGELLEDDVLTGGIIPTKFIDTSNLVRAHSIRGALKEVRIKHKTGGYSTLGFKSYSQGQHAFMGSIKDLIIVDEEPTDEEIHPQLLARTINGDKKRGGHILLAMTPENGVTTLVDKFMNHPTAGEFMKNVSWDDAPHITPARQKELLAAMPEHLREMRSKGVPLMGSGAVYPVADSDLYANIPSIPEHWARLAAIDFGWDHPTAVVWTAWDRDADIMYLYDLLRVGNQTPLQIAPSIRSRGDWIGVAYPHDGLQHDKGSGEQLRNIYKRHGVKMLPERATFADGSAGVEAGIMEILERMQTGRLKVASHLSEFFEEKRLYHRKDGKIIKKRDDILDALRYNIMMKRFARTNLESGGISLPPRYTHSRRRKNGYLNH